jgi:uncharacterized protein (TIGR02757 family)
MTGSLLKPARHRLLNRDFLESVYADFTDPVQIGFDPIRYPLHFTQAADQEVMGLVSACLAYGNVKQISRSMDLLAEVMGNEPASCIQNRSAARRAKALPRFQHRWTSREDILVLWESMHRVLNEFGSLEQCFKLGIETPPRALEQGLNHLVSQLQSGASSAGLRVLSKPENGSACKRMLMYLRWMVRRDAVDPGPWRCLSPEQLRMPVDTHIYRTAHRYFLTRRKSVNWRTVTEITQWFSTVCPEDPVRYDFALTRLGMKGRSALDEAVHRFWTR